ncbi:hypothetical protein, partial [Aeromonas caviae]|uniref:hypothetical protein n=1 Tax=Aeromonas caviae TaxID=648 RepID=UPI001CC81B07
AHDVMVPSWRDQARGNSGSRDDRLTFSCQCHLGEQLPAQYQLNDKLVKSLAQISALEYENAELKDELIIFKCGMNTAIK